MELNRAYKIIGLNEDVTDIKEISKAYRQKIFSCHPDHGGTDSKFIALQKAYTTVMTSIKYTGKRFNKESQSMEDILKNYEEALINKMMELINNLSHVKDININIMGDWIWLDGDTKPYKDKIKSMNFKFSKNKTAWYWHDGTYRKRGRTNYSMSDIELRHGKVKIQQTRRKTLEKAVA